MAIKAIKKKAPAKKAVKPAKAEKIELMPEVKPAKAVRVIADIKSVTAELSDGRWLIKLYKEVQGSLQGSLERSKFDLEGTLSAGEAIGKAIDQM